MGQSSRIFVVLVRAELSYLLYENPILQCDKLQICLKYALIYMASEGVVNLNSAESCLIK